MEKYYKFNGILWVTLKNNYKYICLFITNLLIRSTLLIVIQY